MKNITKLSVICLVFAILIQSTQSYGWYGRRGWHGHEMWHGHYWGWHSYYGYPWLDVSVDFFPTVIGGVTYYYHDGAFYMLSTPDEYVVVTPPVGAVVATIPGSFKPVTIKGVTYFTNNGTYYVNTSSGFQVVASPVTVVDTTKKSPTVAAADNPGQPAPVAQSQLNTTNGPVAVVPNSDESFTVNIPDSKGGFTPVVLKRSGHGFIGPQGEFYAEFPRVSQLKVMYGK